jgi:hypothetical protein
MAHRVRRHIWDNGILHTFDEIFHDLEQALEYANGQAASHVKIYDENDQVTHVLGPVLESTYA